MKKRVGRINHESESYDTIDEAVEAIFMNKNDKKRMFFVIFFLMLVGVVIVSTGTHFLIKQQDVIERNNEIDWKDQYMNGIPLKNKAKNTESVEKKLQSSEFGEVKGVKEIDEAKILFVGDLMLDRYNRELMDKKNQSWMTEKVGDLFIGNDLSVANLEGPVTESESVSVGSVEGSRNNYIFTFDPNDTSEFLKRNNINLLNLGNNHILNFGKEGLVQTKKFISKNGFEYFGDIQDETDGFIEKSINGLRVAFVSYNEFGGKELEETKKIIGDLESENDLTIVYTHWGTEYALNENETQRKKAYEFIDAGADLIIGSHPHVVQLIEFYKNKVIFYSLGNFIFDQYFSTDTMMGLGVKASIINGNDFDFELIPLQLQRNGQIEFANQQEKKVLLERILKTKEIKERMKY